MLTILFDGIAYGMLLFVWRAGSSVTLGLMNFVNLAHGAFAMAGGYITVVLVNRLGVPFLASLPLAFVRHRAGRRRIRAHALSCTSTRKTHLDQVLFSIGLVFMSVAAVDYVDGLAAAVRHAPDLAAGPDRLFGVGIGRYRLLIIVDLRRADGRAAVRRSRRRASAAGCAPRSTTRASRAGSASTSTRVFAVTFAVGSGLAGLGGALGAEILGLDPTFPLKYMIYFLIVVTVGGTSSITGPFLASLVLGIGDVAGKYYVPQLGAFIIYTIMIVVLICGRRACSRARVRADERDRQPRRPGRRCRAGRAAAAQRAALAAAGNRVLARWRVATVFLLPTQAPDPHRDRDPRRCSRSRST